MAGARRIAAVAMFFMGLSGARAGEPEVRLIPGVQVEFEVPGTPPSLADRWRGTGAKAVRMSVKLPKDYAAGRSYPLLVFLSGGDGGGGGELHQAEPLLGGTDYILCNMPLFKQDIQGETDDQKLVVTTEDAAYALPAYHLLFDELHRLVPNIDASRSVLGGFSNGAYTIALFLWAGDAKLLSNFSAFLLVEGGFWLASDRDDIWPDRRFQPAALAGLQGKRALLMYGDRSLPSDRIPWVRDVQRTAEALRRAGVETAVMPMANVGHDFPPEEIARARRWILSEP